MGEKRIFDKFGNFEEKKKEYLIILEILISSVVFIYLFQETKEFDFDFWIIFWEILFVSIGIKLLNSNLS